MTRDRRHVIIIGGGASGVLLACHLLRDGGDSIQITLVEKRNAVGLGTAYSTSHPRHLLNVRGANMSAFADDPGHFQRWLTQKTEIVESETAAGMVFAPRKDYGRYIASLIDSFDPERTRLNCVSDEVVSVSSKPEGVTIALKAGDQIAGDFAVLATGFSETSYDDAVICSPWAQPISEGLSPDAAVLILGTGLTMVDIVIELRSSGHTGPIYAISRRGLLPQTHRATTPLKLSEEEIPFGQSILLIWRWLRTMARREEEAGRDWRNAVDAIRPFTGQLWRRLPLESKRRFLRHARPWWDIHRHRMAPAISSEVASACAWDQLHVQAAKVTSIKTDADGALVSLRRRGSHQIEELRVSRVFPCMGVSTNPAASTNPVLVSLLQQGLARPDELGLGLDIAENGALKDMRGVLSARLFAVGPITRGAYWEMIAVPDIRLQCARLASELVRS